MVQAVVYLDEVVGLVTQAAAVVPRPGRGAEEPPHVGRSPAGLLLDFACESLQKRFPLLDMTAHDVPGPGKQATVRTPLPGRGTTLPVEDDSADGPDLVRAGDGDLDIIVDGERPFVSGRDR